MDMHRSTAHEMLARQTSDDVARTQFIIGLKRYMRTMSKGNETACSTRAQPRFQARHGRAPETVEELGSELEGEPYYQVWSALTRAAQEMMWDAVETTIARDTPRMRDAARRLCTPGKAKGTLSLDPEFVPPRDVLVADIHCQPGGYMRDGGKEDLIAGALYESGGNVYSSGAGIGQRDSKAGAVIGLLSERFPAFRPMRILDLGCSAGGASVAYAASFPDAEVHAVDVGPGILRYAHARAEALGVAVHYHQMSVSALDFPDGSFDLVVSHNLMHEIARDTMAGLFAESRRVLRPGGLAVHQDVPIRGNRSLLERYMFAWETKYNNEPFWQVFAEADVPSMLAQAGFASGAIEETHLKRVDGPGSWYVALAQKSAET
jgi:ubiquinone/menaquinone biosynthesis C-methylase UbiE